MKKEIGYVKFTPFRRSLCKTGLTAYGLNPVFVLRPRSQDGVHWNQPTVELIKYLFS